MIVWRGHSSRTTLAPNWRRRVGTQCDSTDSIIIIISSSRRITLRQILRWRPLRRRRLTVVTLAMSTCASVYTALERRRRRRWDQMITRAALILTLMLTLHHRACPCWCGRVAPCPSYGSRFASSQVLRLPTSASCSAGAGSTLPDHSPRTTLWRDVLSTCSRYQDALPPLYRHRHHRGVTRTCMCVCVCVLLPPLEQPLLGRKRVYEKRGALADHCAHMCPYHYALF